MLTKKTPALDAILAEVTSEFGEQLTGLEGTITADFSLALALVCPKPYLESLFRNMISNALKYRHPNRRLQLLITSHRNAGLVVSLFRITGSVLTSWRINIWFSSLFTRWAGFVKEKEWDYISEKVCLK
ncbi:MAG: hypothetical protein V4714_02695 [Bacteroidota bacterium]